MARIPDGEIERLKSEVSVERLVEAAGIELRRGGKDLVGRCPFHEDDTASLVVTPAKNLWHCFGCGIGGGPIDWTMKMNGVSFRHAVELLRADPTLAAGDEVTGAMKRSHVRKLPAPVVLDAGEQELLDQVIGYYHETLLSSPEAMGYLARRGIADRELIEAHRLGFANRTLGLRLPTNAVKAGAELRGRLQRTGILRESGHEHFNGCLVVPVFDAAGHVAGAYGRKITTNVNPPLHLYLPGPHRGVWNERALVAAQEVILTEALIDAMTFWCAGFRNVTSAYGVEGATEELIALLTSPVDGRPRRVLIAFDRDEAGDRGAVKVAERLMATGVDCYRVQFPKGMDANEYAVKVTPAAKSLGILLRKAQWMGKGDAPAEVPGQRVEDVPEDVPPPSLAAIELAPTTAVAEASAEAKAGDDELVMSFGDRRYRVRGLAKNLGSQTLRVNVLVSVGDAYHVDTLDLYAARARAQFIGQAAKELGVRDEAVKLDLGRLLVKLESVQAEHIAKALAVEPAAPVMSEAETAEAMALLRAPELMDRILADLDACGLVGEATNKLTAYLAATSRKCEAPLAVVVQSSSAAGKSSLMDAVLAFMPEEERVKYSAMTGQSLFYMGETNLKHKILAIAEEEGAKTASYALKLLQSEGELTIASTGKDAATGSLVTQQYRVEGPVMIMLTTTAIEIDEELLNRCLVLAVDEGREQTRQIHERQRARRTLAGLKAKHEKARILRLHRNAQRLLRPLAVVNPYADRLTFLSDKTRTRRDHEKYLTLIDTIALLHQHQRPVHVMNEAGQVVEYVEVTMDDIARANALAHEVLGRSLDELPPQTRRLLAMIVEHVRGLAASGAVRQVDVRFTRKELRAVTGWGDTQLRVHLDRLLSLEYLLAHREGAGGRFAYELLYDGDAGGGAHLAGLIDTESLGSSTTMAKLRGARAEVAAPLRPGCGPVAAPSRGVPLLANPALARLSEDCEEEADKMHLQRANGKAQSYVGTPIAEALR
jgi:DNA primase catalytic core